MAPLARRTVGLVILLCLALVVAAGAGLVPTDRGSQTAGTLQTESTEETTTNLSVRHQHPDEYEDDRDPDATAAWLANQLADRLEDSSVDSDGAADLLGDDYDTLLEQYAELSDEIAAEEDETAEGDTDADGADGEEPSTDETNETAGDQPTGDGAADTGGGQPIANAFEEAADGQERFAELVEEYDDTYAAYEAARDAGDEAEALALARDLEALAAEITDVHDALLANYRLIESETDSDFTAQRAALDETTNAVHQDQAAVRDEQFTETTLDVEAAADTTSIRDPLTVTGQVRTAENASLADKSIQLLIDGEPTTVETAADGTFTAEYQPTPTTERSIDAIEIRYVPDEQSEYLGSTATLPVSIEPVNAEITGLETPAAVSYGDALAISGDVTVGAEPVDGVPLAVRLGDVHLGEVTATDGAIDGAVTVPADVPTGDRQLTLGPAATDRALTAADATTTVTVTETATEAAITATRADEETIAVNGTLETADGTGVANQSVAIEVENETVATVTTDSDGAFSATTPLPAATTEDEAAVRAGFDGRDTNLAATTAETTVPLDAGDASSGESLLSAEPWLVGVGLLTVLTALGGLGWWRHRDTGGHESTDEPGPVADTTPSDRADPSPSETAPAPTRDDAMLASALLSQAARHRSAGKTDDAVRLGYTAVRTCLPAAADDRALTHWEFFAKYAEQPATDTRQLKDVTTEYERAAFSPAPVSDQAAEDVLTGARDLCGLDDEATADHAVVADD